MSERTLPLIHVAVVQVVVAIVAVAVGAATGWYLGQDAFKREVQTALGSDLSTAAQRLAGLQDEYDALFAHCEPLEGSERDRLIEAQERVESLRSEITEREEELQVLEQKAKENVALKKELETRRRELRGLKGALETAEQQREELVEKLKTAIEEVSVARAEATAAKRETLGVKWDEFVANAMLEICEKGSRKKLDKCRSTVQAAMTPDRALRYRDCVRQGNMIPELRVAGKGETDLPAFAEWVDQSDRSTKDEWYILFCDPTLPEAGEGGLPEQQRVGESDPTEALGREDAFLEGLNDEEDF